LIDISFSSFSLSFPQRLDDCHQQYGTSGPSVFLSSISIRTTSMQHIKDFIDVKWKSIPARLLHVYLINPSLKASAKINIKIRRIEKRKNKGFSMGMGLHKQQAET